MAVLHSFWWEEGDRAFDQVLEADSSCAMAYWGRALNAWGNPFAGGPTGPALSGAPRPPTAPRRCRRGPRASAGSSRPRGPLPRSRLTSNAGRLQSLRRYHGPAVSGFPKDVEVAIYYALSRWPPRRHRHHLRSTARAIAILDPLFAQHPDHPGLAHYVIHATDYPGSPAWVSMRPGAMPMRPPRRTLSTCRRTSSSGWATGTRPSPRTSGPIRRASITPRRWARRHAGGVPRPGLRRLWLSPAGPGLGRPRDGRRGRGAVSTDSRGLVALQPDAPWRGFRWRPGTGPRLRRSRARGFAGPRRAALARFTRAIGSARAGGRCRAPRGGGARLDRVPARGKGRALLVAVVRIKRDAAEAWVTFAAGDTAGGLALAARRPIRRRSPTSIRSRPQSCSPRASCRATCCWPRAGRPKPARRTVRRWPGAGRARAPSAGRERRSSPATARGRGRLSGLSPTDGQGGRDAAGDRGGSGLLRIVSPGLTGTAGRSPCSASRRTLAPAP